MDRLQEVVIDEARWPRMFAKLRRAGFRARCGCYGCESCQTKARRFVRGLSQESSYTGSYIPYQRGSRLVTIDRDFGNRRVGLLIDMRREPKVIDISIRPENDNEQAEVVTAMGEDTVWNAAIDYRSKWPGGEATKRHLKSVPKTIMEEDYPNIATGLAWVGFATFEDLSRLPSDPGLYLIVWENGAYLGSTGDSQGIQNRVKQHLAAFKKIGFVPLNPKNFRKFRVIWQPKTWIGQPSVTKFEDKYLNRIASRPIAEGQSVSAVRQAAYRRVGFRNLRELEFESPDDLNMYNMSRNEELDEELGSSNRWLTAIESRTWPSGAKEALRNVYQQVSDHVKQGEWEGPKSFAQLDDVPEKPGLYFIIWPTGAYLGLADNLHRRVGQHRTCAREFNYEPLNRSVEFRYKVFWLEAPKGKNSGGIHDLENRYLNLIAGFDQAPRMRGSRAMRAVNRLPGLRRRGFRNQQEVNVDALSF